MSHKISAIITAYNESQHLAKALNSILSQTLNPFEVIVVDDGSTDETAQVAKSFSSVNYLYQENLGPAAARNKGIELAQGNFVAFLDGDDLWSKDKLEKQITFFEQSPQIDLVAGLTQLIDSQDKITGKPIFSFLMGAILFKKSIFEQIGPFDESLTIGEDADFIFRIRESNAFHIKINSDVVLYYRRHEYNLTKNKLETNKSFVNVLKRSINRRSQQSIGEVMPLPELELPPTVRDLLPPEE